MSEGSNNPVEEKRPVYSRRKEQLLELLVFLFLIFPSLILSFFAVGQGGMSFMLIAGATMLRDFSLVSLILFFIWRNGEPAIAIGWTAQNVRKDISMGIWLFIPFFFAASLLEASLHKAGLPVSSTPLPAIASEKGIAGFVLAFFLVITVALAEETIFRGYLILRFSAVTSSPAAAVLLSAVFFSLGHGYEGTVNVITTGFMGVMLALIYLWRKSLTAPIVIHFLQDFVAIVLVPLLKQLKLFVQ
ncbi:MAG: CPBP family intramembrane metalloprotease [Nitrospirales bacterium]|nr:CPBP family intramembrane metalloprotease [Nitrospirales bacterium]